MKRIALISICTLAVLSMQCSGTAEKVEISAQEYHDAVQQLTDVSVHDIFSPPAASRVYAYPTIAAYEILVQNDSSYKSLEGQLTDFQRIPSPTSTIDYSIAAIEAFLIVGKSMIFSEDRMETFRNDWHRSLEDRNVDSELFENSKEYAQQVADHIIAWRDMDNYKETRTFSKWTIQDEADQWRPTPPGYMEAIEPHWNKIRPFVIDSATQFAPIRPTDYNMEEGSQFYDEVMYVYNVGNELDEEQAEIASFWDCNPYVMNVHGHVMFATKKITPGGHWMGIVKIASLTDNASLMKSATAYALTSISLSDAFISCWDEKYRSNLVRPETVINNFIDEDWAPLLQTPPFPEYTSGHSVISSAAGTMLTDIFGENFSFVDSTEVRYGLPIRNFESFEDAYKEAAVSRLYGGIHYMPAIDNGVTQGKALGEFIVNKLEYK